MEGGHGLYRSVKGVRCGRWKNTLECVEENMSVGGKTLTLSYAFTLTSYFCCTHHHIPPKFYEGYPGSMRDEKQSRKTEISSNSGVSGNKSYTFVINELNPRIGPLR